MVTSVVSCYAFVKALFFWHIFRDNKIDFKGVEK